MKPDTETVGGTMEPQPPQNPSGLERFALTAESSRDYFGAKIAMWRSFVGRSIAKSQRTTDKTRKDLFGLGVLA